MPRVMSGWYKSASRSSVLKKDARERGKPRLTAAVQLFGESNHARAKSESCSTLLHLEVLEEDGNRLFPKVPYDRSGKDRLRVRKPPTCK